MGYPAAPQWPSQPPTPRSAVDLTASIIAMAITVLTVAAGAVLGLLSVAFLDNCPPQTCSAEAAVVTVLGTGAVVGLTAVAGIVITIVRLTSRKTAWPFALGTLLSCVAGLFIGALAYGAAVS